MNSLIIAKRNIDIYQRSLERLKKLVEKNNLVLIQIDQFNFEIGFYKIQSFGIYKNLPRLEIVGKVKFLIVSQVWKFIVIKENWEIENVKKYF